MSLPSTKQSLDVGELEFDVSRAPVITLAGIGRSFHFAKERIHFLWLETTPGAHRAVTGHRRCDLHQAAFERQGFVPLAHMFGEIADEAGAIDFAEESRRFP